MFGNSLKTFIIVLSLLLTACQTNSFSSPSTVTPLPPTATPQPTPIPITTILNKTYQVTQVLDAPNNRLQSSKSHLHFTSGCGALMGYLIT